MGEQDQIAQAMEEARHQKDLANLDKRLGLNIWIAIGITALGLWSLPGHVWNSITSWCDRWANDDYVH